MVVRRRFASVPPMMMMSHTRSSRSFEAMPSRAARYLLASPLSRADKMAYDTRAEDYMTDRVNNASYFSSYALEEGYDTAKKSRNRDAQLLRDATDAIVHSESFATPQASVAARRVARGQSVVPLRATSAPPRPIYPEAALIASRMEVDSLPRRPRSEYAARKYRAMRRADQESIYTKGPRTSAYYASSPPLPKLTERKAIRTEEGYSKPKNLLSWQYRLDAIMRPSDLLYQPTSSFGRIRRQVRAAQEGMDRHRQLLDRYLPEEGAESTDAAARVLRKMAEMERRDPVTDVGAAERQRSTVKIPSYYACGVDPANPPKSDLRRRIQRTLNKTRRS